MPRLRLALRSRRTTRRSLRTLALASVAALAVLVSVSCAPPPGGVKTAWNIAGKQLRQRGWTPQAQCLINLWQAESGWNVYAVNRASGAYGIPQALPANRMRSAGRDWVHNPATQIRWGLDYIKQRYGGPCNAWRAFQRQHWYMKAEPTAGEPGGTPAAGTVSRPVATS
jgi:transglycosylase-like protein with SLT domain